jgi:hypothetical protein
MHRTLFGVGQQWKGDNLLLGNVTVASLVLGWAVFYTKDMYSFLSNFFQSCYCYLFMVKLQD